MDSKSQISSPSIRLARQQSRVKKCYNFDHFTQFQVILNILRAHKSHQTHFFLALESAKFARKMGFFAEKMANLAQQERNSAKQRFWNIPSRPSRWNRRPIDGNRPLFFPKAPGIAPISCEKNTPKWRIFSRFLQFLGSSKDDPKIDYAREPKNVKQKPWTAVEIPQTTRTQPEEENPARD